MRILFVNQYFPPDPAPTGVLLREVAEALAAEGHFVDFVDARQDYRGGQQQGHRMRRELAALVAILRRGLSRPRPDVVISGSSPPCVLVAATLVALWHRARSIHWAMDLYPELALALGEIRHGAAAWVLERSMAWCYRACGEVVVLDADMAERIKRYGVGSKIIRPWVSRAVQEQAACEGERCRAPWTWVYSGNLGRAHEWETLLEAQGLIEAENAEIRLLFQGGGPAWTAAKARAEEMGLKRCDWKDYAPVAELRSSLLDCQCCVASQRPAAKGLLWPSKLALLLTLPRPILWVGSQDGAIAGELRQVPGTGVFAPGQGREIADWVLDLRQKKNTDVVVRVDAGAIRDAALEAWCKLVASCNKTRQPSQAPAIAPARKL